MTAKIFAYVFTMGVLVLVLCGVLFFGLQYGQARDNTYAALQQEAVYAGSGVMLSGEDYLKTLDQSNRITWIKSDGSVLYDSEFGVNAENQLDFPEVKDAVEKGEGHGIRRSEKSGSETMYYAVRCEDGTVLRLSRPLSAIKNAFIAVSPILWMIVFVLILAGVFAFRASRQIIKPINGIKLDDLDKSQIYPELSPLVDRIREQNLTISDQITELTRRQKEFSALTDNMSEGFVLTDRHGVVLSANSSAVRMISGCDVGVNLVEHGRSGVSDLIKTALSGERTDKIAEESGRWRQIIANPILSRGSVTGAAVLTMDVTETAERERLRREFSANVSHELKTPLTSISGFAELMIQDLVPPDKMKEFATEIYDQSHRLMMLIDDIIKLSKLDEQDGPPEAEKVDLFELVCDTVSSLESYAAGKNVTLNIEGDHAYVCGTPYFLDEMIYNLCDNAIKYNRQNGSVTVSVRKEEDHTVLSVKDTGIGIPFEAQDRIFERFFRVDNSRSQDIPGTGLGLSIVKHAAQIHNAKITLASTPNVGTEIKVIFPEYETPETAEAEF
ncbi:MAG: histidine kinase [Clostridia bacterium]|nr:histidine kinase [Clostridia bacterium]